MTQGILFKEKQRFRQWWIWLIVLFIAGSSALGALLALSANTGFSVENTLVPLLLLLLTLALLGFVIGLRLDTEIRTDGIYVRFVPVHKKFRFYSWAELEKVYVRKYSPIGEYGGWGLRGLGKNRALNVSGNEGLQLIMKDGRKLLIGTRKPEEIKAVLIAAGQSNNVLPQ